MTNKSRFNFWPPTLLLVCSVLFCLPLFRSTLQVGQDLEFHLARIRSLSNIFISPVNFNSFAGHGNMISTYYPWLTVYPAFLLIKLLGNILLGYRLFIVIVTCLTGLSAYSCSKFLHVSSTNSLLFALTYMFSTYHAVNIFLRSAVGEIICAAIIPIVFAALYATICGNKHSWIILALGMSAIAYTHVISLLLTAIFCIILTAPFVPPLIHNKQRLLSLIKSAVLTLLLSAGFIVPFVNSFLHENVQLPKPALLQTSGLSLGNLIRSTFTNQLTAFTSGAVITVMLLFSLFQFHRLTHISKILTALCLAMALLQIHSPVLNLLDFLHLNQIQFIWRLNLFSSLFVPYVFWSDAVHLKIKRSNSTRTHLILGFIFIELLLNFVSTSFLFHADTRYFTHGQVTSSQQMVVKLSKYAHGDYRPIGSPSPFTIRGKKQLKPLLLPRNVHVHIMRSDSSITYHLNASKPGIVLKTGLYYYKNLQISHNKQTNVLRHRGLLEANTRSNKLVLSVSSRYSLLTRISWSVSTITFTICLLLLLKLRKKNRKFQDQKSPEC